MRLDVEDTEKKGGGVFLEYGTLLMVVPLFKYLDRTFLPSKDNWTAV